MSQLKLDARTVKELKEMLALFPEDALIHAYEGEVTAVVVNSADGEQLGFISTRSP